MKRTSGNLGEDNKRLFVFDLDGTLADTRQDIAASVNESLRTVGLSPLPLPTVLSFVGDGAQQLIYRCFQYYGIPSEHNHCRQVLSFFRAHYLEHLLDQTRLYPEVHDTLERLPSPKAVLTNKPTTMSVKLLQGLGIAHHFSAILGGDIAEELKPQPAGLRKLLQQHASKPDLTFMIGDSPIDIQTARNAGVQSVAVTYGLHSREEINQAKPDRVVERFSELLRLI